MEIDDSDLLIVGGNWGAATAVQTLLMAGQRPIWFRGPGNAGGSGPAIVPGSAKLTASTLSDMGAMGARTDISWIEGLTFASPSGQFDTLSTDDLPAPLHLIPSLAGLDVLSWPQRLEIAGGLLAMLQAEPAELLQNDSNTGETFAAWLQQHGQHSPAALAFWVRITVLACASMPQNIAAAQGVSSVRETLLSSPDACRIGVLPAGIGPAIDHVAQALAQQGGQVIDAWPASANFKADESGTKALSSLTDTVDQAWPASACIVADPSVAKQLLEDAGLPASGFSSAPNHPAPAADLRVVYLCVQSTTDAMAEPANCAPLDSGPVQWLIRQPDQAVAGIEGRVTPVWAWVATPGNSPADEEQAIAAAREAVVRLWSNDETLTIKSAEVLPAQTSENTVGYSMTDPSSMPNNFFVFDGAWTAPAGLVGETATNAAIRATQEALTHAGLPTTQAEAAPIGGPIYQFMLG